MLDFLFKGFALRSTQRVIDKAQPKVNVNLHDELPLPSIRQIKKYIPIVAKINSLEEEIAKLSDDELCAKTAIYREEYRKRCAKEIQALEELKAKRLQAADYAEKDNLNIQIEKAEEELKTAKNKYLGEILPEAFAVVREAGKRTLQMRHYDVQLIGGMVLNNGSIAEMTTGEGKTLVATLAAYLNALTGEGVHVVTVNDYLAERDAGWMGPLYTFLGLTVGVILHDMEPAARQEAYACDITYGTNNEFGFDYLRDNMVIDKEDMVQRPHHFAIVDEVDSILIDEARTPLIISGPAEESTDKYYKAYEISKKLKGRRITERDEVDAKHQEIDLAEGYEYLADEKHKSISLSETGEIKVAEMFGVDNIHDMETMEYRHHILQALKAKEFFIKDVDYVAKDGQVIIVDEFTGRMMPGRRWSDGLHQAVEAKEGIKIARENQTLATITFQNYFRLYEKLSGMTGTAYTEATEFKEIYKLEVVAIPTNRKLQRLNYSDAIYRSQREKFNAVVNEIAELHEKGVPCLVGTISIEKSELLSRLLKQKGIAHNVLNAKFHAQEANIIAQAGRYKAVTIATNMAGRGTDIVLGGNPEFLAKNLAAEKNEEDVEQFLDQFKKQCKEEQQKVLEAGGLHVLGTERHESRRIDNQLRGRQGRQGDPGASKFYISLEDDLMRLFASERIIGLMDKLGMEEGQVLEHPLLNRALENAQKRVETQNFEIRKHLLEYDNVMNRQREVIYERRREILESENMTDMIFDAVDNLVYGLVTEHLFKGEEQADRQEEDFFLAFKGAFHLDVSAHREHLETLDKEETVAFLIERLKELFQKREEEFGASPMRAFEKMLMLNIIDSKWKEHLYAMDQLKEGIGLRSYGQRDPVMEYKREGFLMFEAMYGSIQDDIAQFIFKMQPLQQEVSHKGIFQQAKQNFIHDEIANFSHAPQPAMEQAQANSPEAPKPVRNTQPKVGRNDPCPCGSGKKYKKCCGQ